MNRHSFQQGLLFVSFLFVLSYVFAKFQGGFVSWFLFYSFLPIFVYSIFQYFFSFRGLEVDREGSKERLMAGGTVEMTLTLHNPYRFPLIYVRIHDHLDPRLHLKTTANQLVIYPWFRKKTTVSYSIQDLPRGYFSWQQIDLETGDLFGFIKKRNTVNVQAAFTVYPQYKELPHWRAFNEKNRGQRYTINRHDEDVSTVLGIRDYIPGDRLSRIHWKATARTGELKTKEFEYQVTNDFMFFLDRQTTSYGSETHPLFERAVTLTASLIHYALQRNFSVGLISDGKRKRTRFTLSNESEQMFRVLEHLAPILADAPHSLEKTMLREVVYLPKGITVVVISAQVTQALIQLLGELSQRKMTLQFFWIKDSEQASSKDLQVLHQLEKEKVNCFLVSNDRLDFEVAGDERYDKSNTV